MYSLKYIRCYAQENHERKKLTCKRTVAYYFSDVFSIIKFLTYLLRVRFEYRNFAEKFLTLGTRY